MIEKQIDEICDAVNKILRGIGGKVIRNNVINKTFTRKEIKHYVEVSPTVNKLRCLVDQLTRRKLLTTSAGDLLYSNLSEQIKYQYTVYNMRAWEYGRVFDILELNSLMKVLDCGGASSPLVFYCARKGIDTTTVDLQESLVENTNYVSKKMGWKINALVQDMTELSFEDNYFDTIFCISVLEHMNNNLKSKAMREFKRVLKPGGKVGITFDFGKSVNDSTSYDYDKHAQFHTSLKDINEIEEFLIKPSGLKIYGNTEFEIKIDSDRKFIKQVRVKESIKGNSFIKDFLKLLYIYSPCYDTHSFHYTFFSLFLEKGK